MKKDKYSIKVITGSGLTVNYPVCKSNNIKYINKTINNKFNSLDKCIRKEHNLYLYKNGIKVRKLIRK